MAVNEPALSFEFDSSQSLFEQLTKAQQANTSSFTANTNTNAGYSQSTSPVMRAVDAMPPPQMVPQSMPMVQEEPSQTAMYNNMAMQNQQMVAGLMKREQDYGQIQYDRNGIPLSRAHQRHTSMPNFVEYSPAPSFVSSQYPDYSDRGISFEPITPPQHAMPLGAEPAYIANEDTGLYTAIPDMGPSQIYNPMMQLGPSMGAPQYTASSRPYPSNNVYSVIEGSPTYKQRRRRSSIPPSITAAVAAAAANPQPHAVHRPSDLRRSMSSSVVPVAELDETTHNESPPPMPHNYPSAIAHQRDLLQELSRHSTPLPTLEGSPSINPMAVMQHHDDLSRLTNGDLSHHSVPNSSHNSPAPRPERPGPVRRARSATMMELGPYPNKSHSCPIPTCGRLFKRLEHLKR